MSEEKSHAVQPGERLAPQPGAFDMSTSGVQPPINAGRVGELIVAAVEEMSGASITWDDIKTAVLARDPQAIASLDWFHQALAEAVAAGEFAEEPELQDAAEALIDGGEAPRQSVIALFQRLLETALEPAIGTRPPELGDIEYTDATPIIQAISALHAEEITWLDVYEMTIGTDPKLGDAVAFMGAEIITIAESKGLGPEHIATAHALANGEAVSRDAFLELFEIIHESASITAEEGADQGG